MALGSVTAFSMAMHPTYMWVVPMFHCNGWGNPYTLTALAGTSVCLRYVSAKNLFDAIADHKVTHFGGAPIVLNFIAQATDDEKRDYSHKVNVVTAGAPPPAATLEAVQQMGFDVTHVYGLTETYGHVSMCAWQDEWNELSVEEQSKLRSMQGVKFTMMEGLTVMNPETMKEVKNDGEEIIFNSIELEPELYNSHQSSNSKNSSATTEEFSDINSLIFKSPGLRPTDAEINSHGAILGELSVITCTL